MPTQQSRLTVAQLRDRVRGDIGARSNNFVTDADIDAWAQEASDTIATETKWYRLAEQSFPVTALQAEYDLPAELLALEAVRFDLKIIWPISIENLPRQSRLWQQQSGTPYLYYFRGSTKIGLYPKPATTSATLCKIDYAANAPLPALTTEKYNIPLGSDTLLIAYCCYRASIKDITAEGIRRVPIFKQEWDMGLRDLKGQFYDKNEGETLIGGSDGRFISDLTVDGWNPYSVIS